MPVNFGGNLDALSVWLRSEYRDAIAARRSYEYMLDEWDRQYEMQPRVAVKSFPWPNASNLETPVGATHTDTIVSRLETAYFSTQPYVVVRALQGKYVENAQALQDYMNQVSLPNSGYRREKAIDLLAMTKLGTSFQWLTYEYKTKHVRRADNSMKQVVVHEGPLQRFVHPRHLIAPPDARDIENARWLTVRNYKTWGELTSTYSPATLTDLEGLWTNNNIDYKRERRQGIRRVGQLHTWEVPTTYCLYQEEPYGPLLDLWVDWHYPSGKIIRAIYNPYDHARWPLSKTQYMHRESAFSGIGVMAMLSTIQEEITTIHNYCLDNLLAANTVVALGKKNSIKSLEIAPMSLIEYTGNKDDIRFERIGSALSGQQVGEASANAYAERRTGVSEGNVNRAAPQRGLSSSRTPATTTLALIGESNKRFQLAIENSKQADSELLMQHAMLLKQFWPRQRRYADLWHPDKANLIDKLFAIETELFKHNIVIEVAASSSSVNQELEKQNMLVLGNYMKEFYGLFLMFVRMQAEAPQLEPLIKKIINGISTFAERLLRTFDVRDPERFILRLDDIGASVAAQPLQGAEEFTNAFVRGEAVGATNGTAGR